MVCCVHGDFFFFFHFVFKFKLKNTKKRRISIAVDVLSKEMTMIYVGWLGIKSWQKLIHSLHNEADTVCYGVK